MKNKEIEDMEGELGQISLQNHLLSLNIKTMRQNVGVKDREVIDGASLENRCYLFHLTISNSICVCGGGFSPESACTVTESKW